MEGELQVEKKLKVLKAVLLLRRINRDKTKERQAAMVGLHYSEKEIDEWIGFLKRLRNGFH